MKVLIFILALISILITGPVVFFFQLFRKKYYKESLSEYIYSLSIGIDQLGGTIIYGLEDWKISSVAYYDAKYCNKNIWFMNFINFLFQDKEHCKKSYKHEFNELKIEPIRNKE